MPIYEHKSKKLDYPVIYMPVMYDIYRGMFKKKYRNPFFLNRKMYEKFIKRYHEKWMDAIINEAAVYNMPFKLGRLYITKCKSKLHYNEDGSIDYKKSKLGIDFNKTKKYGKTMYHMNTHTNGYRMRIHWQKKDYANVVNITYFKFKPAVRYNTKLNRAIMNKYVKGEIDYIEQKNTYDGHDKSKEQDRENSD